MPNGYWNAHSDLDWYDRCGMLGDEPPPEEDEPFEESEAEALVRYARAWDEVLSVLFGEKK